MSVHASLAAAHKRLFEAAEAGSDLSKPWVEFADSAATLRANPPNHLATVFRIARELGSRHPDREIKILDHGCGGGVTLLLLLADGFTGIHGVDMPQARCEALNRVTRELFAIPEQRFFRYSGDALPFADHAFDLILSQQVIEHVVDTQLAAYYSEEGRILRPGGCAYHQVPHRFVPYDTHSRTWFLHWLPRRLQMAGYRILKRNAAYLDSMLFLRSPRTHLALAEKYIGPVEDVTAQRLAIMPDFESYDGPIATRRIIHRAVNIPVFGNGIARALKNLVMLETIAHKT